MGKISFRQIAQCQEHASGVQDKGLPTIISPGGKDFCQHVEEARAGNRMAKTFLS